MDLADRLLQLIAGRLGGGRQPPTVTPGLPASVGLPTTWIVAAPAGGQMVHRLVGKSEPRERDFQSDREKKRPSWPDQDFIDHVGISVFGTPEAAIANATRFPKLIASLRLEPGNGFSIARTEADIDEHYSVWGDPEALQQHVARVMRIDDPS